MWVNNVQSTFLMLERTGTKKNHYFSHVTQSHFAWSLFFPFHPLCLFNSILHALNNMWGSNPGPLHWTLWAWSANHPSLKLLLYSNFQFQLKHEKYNIKSAPSHPLQDTQIHIPTGTLLLADKHTKHPRICRFTLQMIRVSVWQSYFFNNGYVNSLW